MNCVRLLFCFYNFLFLVVGGIVLGLGVWFAVDVNADGVLKELLSKVGEKDVDTSNDIVQMIRQASFVLIAFGGFIFLLSFLGYCGTIKESRFLLGFYSFLLTLILILEVVSVILIFLVYGPQIEEETKKILKENLISRYGEQNETKLTSMIDKFMIKNACCGIYNGKDFKESRIVASMGDQVPESCCKEPWKSNCTKKPTDENSNTNTGCYERIKNELVTDTGKLSALIVGVVICILQLVGIVFACWIYKEAKYSFE